MRRKSLSIVTEDIHCAMLSSSTPLLGPGGPYRKTSGELPTTNSDAQDAPVPTGKGQSTSACTLKTHTKVNKNVMDLRSPFRPTKSVDSAFNERIYFNVVQKNKRK